MHNLSDKDLMVHPMDLLEKGAGFNTIATDFLLRKQNLTIADDEVMVSFDVVSLALRKKTNFAAVTRVFIPKVLTLSN